MSSTFPRTSKKTLGYNASEVDEFLASAREAYDSTEDASLSASDIRRTAFGMQKGGYSPQHVDAALERLEDAFAARERERASRTGGDRAWQEEARAHASEIVTRLARPVGHRFTRVSLLSVGYRRADVDRFADKLVKYFQEGWPVSPDDVRMAVFRPQRGGYREAQVDAVMDAVIDVMLAVR